MATYLELYNLHETQTSLKSRSKVALAKFAAYTLGLNANPEDVAWAKNALNNVDSIVNRFFWEFIADPAVVGAQNPDTLTDAQVQAIVETITRKY